MPLMPFGVFIIDTEQIKTGLGDGAILGTH